LLARAIPFFLSASSQPSQAAKTLGMAGPAIIIVLVIAGALLGYYQAIYYPKFHTTTTIAVVPADPFNATVTIPHGAANANATYPGFLPDNITVIIGYNATVIWRNNDTGVQHTVTSRGNSPDPRFDAFGPQTQPYNVINPPGQAGDTLNFTFTIAGNYPYYCSFHPNMQGVVHVISPPPGFSSTSSSKQSASASATSTSSSSAVALLRNFYSALLAASATLAKSLETLTGSGTAP
jgi:plastocyanin